MPRRRPNQHLAVGTELLRRQLEPVEDAKQTVAALPAPLSGAQVLSRSKRIGPPASRPTRVAGPATCGPAAASSRDRMGLNNPLNEFNLSLALGRIVEECYLELRAWLTRSVGKLVPNTGQYRTDDPVVWRHG